MSTSSENYKKDARVNLGEKDGVKVIANEETLQYEITIPNIYDVYLPIKSRDFAIEFEPKLEEGQKRDWGVRHFAVPVKQMETSYMREQFNIKINQCRKEYREVVQELDQMKKGIIEPLKNGLAWEGKGDMEIVFNQGVPASQFIKGEVLAIGKYNTLFNGGDKDDKHYVQVVESNRLLSGKEFENRVQSLHAKLRVGDEMYIPFKDGKASKIDYSEFQKDLNAGLSKEDAKELQKQREEDRKAIKELAQLDPLAKLWEKKAEQEPAKEEPKQEKETEVKKSRSRSKAKETEREMT